MRWTGQGCTKLRSCDGHASRHKFGCGFAVGESLRHLASRFTAVDERLAAIRIQAKYFYISLICAHAPTEDKNDTGMSFTTNAKFCIKEASVPTLKCWLPILMQKWGEMVFLAQQSQNIVCIGKQATMASDGIIRCLKHGYL